MTRADRLIDSTGMAPRLVKHESTTNQHRFYQLGLWPDLFGGYSVVREYGRIGQPGRVMATYFDAEATARDALSKLYTTKCRRGYQAVTPKRARCRVTD